MRRLEASIQAGTLALELAEERLPLEELLTFATRANPKRAFLFVSKVLGRHWPCRPSVMRRTYDLLADELAPLVALDGPLMVFGMAETATGLGHGVYDSLLRLRPGLDALYQHTTRHALDRPVALRIAEAHSHAVDHTVYFPEDVHRPIFDRARTLVLVDDEMSTGNTLEALARAYLAHNPRIERIVLVALVSWLPPARLAELEAALGRPVYLRALATGRFEFTSRPGFAPPPAAGAALAARDGVGVDGRFGRLGFRGPLAVAPTVAPPLPAKARLVVVGSGEFVFAPFRLAEELEAAGHDVLFQATTRSPILPGDAIASRRLFPDHHGEGVANFLYNFPEDERLAIVGYERPELGCNHPLIGLLAARCWSPPPIP